MIRRPPRSTQSRSSAASDVYKRQRSRCDSVEPRALPELEHEQAPQTMTVIAFASRVLVEHALDDARLQLLACASPCIQERVSGELPERSTEPVAEGNPEPGLPAGGELGRDEGRERTPEGNLPAPAFEAQGVRQRDPELQH